MKTYGMPYMGSKRKLATRILAAMPQRDTLVDLFCGGCAVAHAAMDGNKFKNIIINDINPICPELFINALSGKYNDEKRWISREDFERLKHTDPYVAVVWSFGNNLRDYMYSREIEPLKRAIHYAIYFDDIQPLTELLPGIELCALNEIKEERARYLFVKHRTEDYLRTHHIAANSALQHFTTANIVSGKEIMGGGTNSIPNGRCSNTSTGDFSYFVRLQHRERNAQVFQIQQSEWGGKSKHSAWTIARWRYRATALSTATYPTRIRRFMARRNNTSAMPSFTNGAPSRGSHYSSAVTLFPTKTSSA